MKLFNLLFGCELEGTEKLFYQGGAAYDAERKSLRFQAGETASFETYFNLFSYAKYRKYCGIQNADVRFEGTGSFLAEFLQNAVREYPAAANGEIYRFLYGAAGYFRTPR